MALVHNFYQQPGGEDQVLAAEAALLQAHGHDVMRYTVHNDAVVRMGRAALARATIWNAEEYQRLRSLFREKRPSVVHVHNTLPLISPAVYDAAQAEGAAVVQTLHNYRLSCVNGLFFRDGRVCEDCLGKTLAWPGVVHACYRDDRAASAVVASMLAFHKLRGTYVRQVDQYIALSEFAREKFVEMGLPGEKMSVKPNFVAPDPGVGNAVDDYVVFVGRLSKEKGLSTLLDAWSKCAGGSVLKILGDGPLGPALRTTSSSGVQCLGRLPRAEVLNAVRGARFLVFPSLWYESFPMTVVEAFSVGTPVVASRLGSAATIVDDGRTGLLFNPGDADDLAAKLTWLFAHPNVLERMRSEAREEYVSKYTPDVNYRQLMDIYDKAMHFAQSRTNARAVR